MDWKLRPCALVLLAALIPLATCWSPTKAASAPTGRQRSAVSPYIDIVLCPVREQPWTCAREQSARILDIWDGELSAQWQKLKVEADRQLNATMEKRGYSASEVPTKEKPSTILKKIEIGTNFMKEYLAETMDGFLGREYDYMQGVKSQNAVDYDYQENGEVENDDNDAESEAGDNNDEEEEDEEDDAEGAGNELPAKVSANVANAAEGDEFIEIEDGDQGVQGQLKRPVGLSGKKQKQKKKKGQTSVGQPATVLLVQPFDHPDDGHHSETQQQHSIGGGGGHRKGDKRKKRKKRPTTSLVHEESSSSDHLGLGLLEELVSADDLLSEGGKRKRKNKHPSKYGRSNGATRGKKRKKKKALMKLVLLGSFLKAKIELLLKILGAHLQIKFFAIALIGLLINIARFWIDVKRGGIPQKVVYVEHAHHQHHYEDHGDDWSEQGGGGGGYWKRSLQTDPSVEERFEGGYTDSYQPRPQPHPQSPHDAQYLAYRNHWQ